MANRECCLFCDEKKGSSHNATCHKLGPVTRNPFLNFMRHLRETRCSRSIIDMAKQAGLEWGKMSDAEKCPFVMQAHRAHKSRRRRHIGRLSKSTTAINDSANKIRTKSKKSKNGLNRSLSKTRKTSKVKLMDKMDSCSPSSRSHRIKKEKM